MTFAPRLIATPLGLAGLLAASALLAQSAPTPKEHVQGTIAYISGGIGSDEAAALRQAAASYPLTLELAAPSDGWRDEYITDAKVDLRDPQGHAVLTTIAAGPLVLIRLPSGAYTVEVAWNGVIKQQTVNVDSRTRQRIVFEFPREGAH